MNLSINCISSNMYLKSRTFTASSGNMKSVLCFKQRIIFKRKLTYLWNHDIGQVFGVCVKLLGLKIKQNSLIKQFPNLKNLKWYFRCWITSTTIVMFRLVLGFPYFYVVLGGGTHALHGSTSPPPGPPPPSASPHLN